MRRFIVVPHTHWDREWYRPFEHFRLELARVVDGVLDVLERDPDFTSFTLDGQAILLEDYVDVRPENEQRLRALIAAGRLEVGPSYVLPDELLVGAEPLVRNLLIGRRVCERFGASPSPVGYLPDSFGHPQQLPQILAGFGIESFIFSRGLGDQLDHVGLVFRWRAPDGSEVVAFQQLGDYGNFALLGGVEDADARAHAIAERFGPTLEQAGVRDVLLGNGSDHLPVQPELPEICAQLEQRNRGTSFEIGTFAAYVEAARPTATPSWAGELVDSRMHNVLRGVNSARLYLKRANEHAERRLGAVETLAALRALQTGAPFPASDFRLAWRELLRCQPHDSICGCSCDEVHRDMLVRYEALDRTLDVLESRALQGFGAPQNSSCVGVINPLPERRTALVELPGHAPALVELEGFAAKTVELQPAPPPPDEYGAAIESDELRVQAEPDGTLTLIDKRCGHRFDRLHALEDELDMGDLYNFCPVEGAGVWRGGHGSARVLSEGPLLWELELLVSADRPAGLDDELAPLERTASLTVRTVVRLTRGSRRVEFVTTLDNQARDHRLRVVFGVPAADAGAAVRADAVRAESQFAVAHRPLHPVAPRTGWVEPPDATRHTLGAVALGPMALLTKGLPEYEARPHPGGADVCLTLVRSVGIISRPSDAIATRPLGAGPQVLTPEGQCLGRHELEYALFLDAGDLGDAALVRASQDYRHGLLSTRAGVQFDPPLEVEGDVAFSCLKGAEDGDGLILRCFNPGDAATTLAIRGPVTISRTRLDETGEQVLDGSDVWLRPGEIGTFRLRAVETA